MLENILFPLFSALILTILIELIVAFFLGYKKNYELLLVVCLNLLTNPIANMLFQFKIIPFTLIWITLIELGVLLIEYFILKKFFPKRNVFVLAFLMNLCSFLVGILFW